MSFLESTDQDSADHYGEAVGLILLDRRVLGRHCKDYCIEKIELALSRHEFDYNEYFIEFKPEKHLRGKIL